MVGDKGNQTFTFEFKFAFQFRLESLNIGNLATES